MEERAYITGLGGQGVMLVAKLIIKTAFHDGMDVLFYPTYGGEQRGGASNAAIAISDTKVAAPNVEKYDVVLYMHQTAYNTAPNAVKPGGTAIINTCLVNEYSFPADVRIVKIDSMAEAEKLGSPKAANMIMLGALAKLMGKISVDHVIETMKEQMISKPKFIELNTLAIQTGATLAEV